jgi:GNAT superfamily N-acetyltransferase
MTIEVRPFRRDDREQVTALVNAHVQAVVPGVSLSVNAVMSQLEREPGEFIVDPWVSERETLVAVERERVVAAAHLLRYADDERVSESYRDAGEIRWLLAWPDAPYWPDTGAGDALARASVEHLRRWNVGRLYADGTLPAPVGVYGIPHSWPHVQAIYERVGFIHEGHIEIVLAVLVEALPRPSAPPVDGLAIHRTLGINGTRLSATLGDEILGFIEVETDFTMGGTLSRFAGWADIGNLCVREQDRRRGVGTWLVAHAAEWLRLGRVERLLTYVENGHDDELAFSLAVGFHELTTTRRGWVLTS